MKNLAKACLLLAMCAWPAAWAQQPFAVYPFTFSVRALMPTTVGDTTTSRTVVHNNASFLKFMQASRRDKIGVVFESPGDLTGSIILFSRGGIQFLGTLSLAGIGAPTPVQESPGAGLALREALATFTIVAQPPGADDVDAVPLAVPGPEAMVLLGYATAQILVVKTSPEQFLQIKPAGTRGRTGTTGSTGALWIYDTPEFAPDGAICCGGPEIVTTGIPTEAIFSLIFGSPLGQLSEFELESVRAKRNALEARGLLTPPTAEDLRALAQR